MAVLIAEKKASEIMDSKEVLKFEEKASEIMNNREKNLHMNDWPEWLPLPTDEDLEMLVELSDRETSSAFFN